MKQIKEYSLKEENEMSRLGDWFREKKEESNGIFTITSSTLLEAPAKAMKKAESAGKAFAKEVQKADLGKPFHEVTIKFTKK